MSRKGFTLIELLVVISIISLLASIVLSSLNAARNRGRMTALALFATQVDHIAGDQLVGSWNFNECSGAVKDISGFGNDGSIPNGATYTADTPIGKGCALSLDGVNDYVNIPNDPSLNFGPNQDFTISYWVKTSMSADPIAKKNTGNTDKGWGILGFSGNHYLYVSDGSTNLYQQAVTGITDGQWHHVLFSIDRDGTCDRYKDGVLIGKTNCSSWASADLTNTKSLYLGANNNNAPSGYLNGTLDDVHIFAKRFTAMEAGKLYAEGLPAHELARGE